VWHACKTSAALHEWYAYVVAFEKTQTRRLGKDMWLVIAIMGVEVRAARPTEPPARTAHSRLTYVCMLRVRVCVCACVRVCVCACVIDSLPCA
jgi:hypothetical protein